MVVAYDDLLQLKHLVKHSGKVLHIEKSSKAQTVLLSALLLLRGLQQLCVTVWSWVKVCKLVYIKIQEM